MRCTAPMNAPGPPPTIPSRIRRCTLASLLPLIAIARLSAQAQHFLVHRRVDAARSEIVEGAFRHANDVLGDKIRAFPCAVLGMFQATLPFQHGPAGIVVL